MISLQRNLNVYESSLHIAGQNRFQHCGTTESSRYMQQKVTRVVAMRQISVR
jgi:hypothetical protein